MSEKSVLSEIRGLKALFLEKFDRNEEQHKNIAKSSDSNKKKIEKIDEVREKYQPMWENQHEERSAIKNKVFDWAWKLFATAVFGASLAPEVAKKFAALFNLA
jgi:hypothetical protein